MAKTPEERRAYNREWMRKARAKEAAEAAFVEPVDTSTQSTPDPQPTIVLRDGKVAFQPAVEPPVTELKSDKNLEVETQAATPESPDGDQERNEAQESQPQA